MATEVTTIPRVYLTDTTINRHSAHHTLFAGEGTIKPGEETPLHRLEFEFGVARDVPLALYNRFKDLGHVTTERPKNPRERED